MPEPGSDQWCSVRRGFTGGARIRDAVACAARGRVYLEVFEAHDAVRVDDLDKVAGELRLHLPMGRSE